MPKHSKKKAELVCPTEGHRAAVTAKVTALVTGMEIKERGGLPYEPTNDLSQFLSSVSPWQEEMESIEAFVWVYGLVSAAAKQVVPNWKEHVEFSDQARGTAVALVVDQILAFPKTYTVYFSLPAAKALSADALISPSISVFTYREPASEKPPISLKGLFALTSYHAPALRSGTTYLRVQTVGLCSGVGHTPAASQAFSKVKRLLALCALFESGLVRARGPSLPLQSDAVFHEAGSPESETLLLEAPSELLTILGRAALEGSPPLGLLRSVANEYSSPIEDLKEHVSLIEDDDKSKELERIRTGLEWAFDSRAASNDTRALIEACIAIEALIGEESAERGLTDRLVDRCSFALAKSNAERQSITGDFRAIYKLRSLLVHGRTPRLAPGQRNLLIRAQELLDRLLAHEIKMLRS